MTATFFWATAQTVHRRPQINDKAQTAHHEAQIIGRAQTLIQRPKMPKTHIWYFGHHTIHIHTILLNLKIIGKAKALVPIVFIGWPASALPA